MILKKKVTSLLLQTVVKGGLGNTRFKSSTNRAPKKFTKGEIGEEYIIWLAIENDCRCWYRRPYLMPVNQVYWRLLLMLTPKIANYKFTTLNPNLRCC